MMIYGIAIRKLCDGKTYYYITLNGEIPSSATRYKTQAGIARAIRSRLDLILTKD